MGPERVRPGRKRLWIALLLLESCFFSGPFLLPMLHIAWCESHGSPPPARFSYVPWLLGTGVILLAGGVVYDIASRLRRAFRSR
jgi:hypothetical protein